MKSMTNGPKSWEREVCIILSGIMKTWTLSKPWSPETMQVECYWRKFCHSEQKNWHFRTNVWGSRIKILTSFLIGWESHLTNVSWLDWMKWMVSWSKKQHKRKDISYFLPFYSSWPLACKIIHPSTLYKKMVDTIPVNNVNSSGSEKKSTKNIRRKKTWHCRHRPQLFRSYKRLQT